MTLPLPPQPPIKEPITSKLGNMSLAWVTFFSNLTSYLKTNKDYVEAPLYGNAWLSGLSQAGTGGYDAVVGLVSAAVADGSLGVNANAVGITTTSQAFTYDTAGFNPAPTSATMTAIETNSYGTLYYEWFLNDVSVQNSLDPIYTYTPKSDFALMPDKVEVQVHQDTDDGIIVSRDMMTMFGLKAGTDALTFILTNEAHTLPVTSGGVVTYTGSGTSILVFEGTTQLVEDSAATPANSTFKVTSAVGTNITPGAVTGTGTTVLSYGDASAMTATAATIVFNLAVKTSSGVVLTLSKTQSLAQSIAGSSGSSGRAPAHLYIGGTSWSDAAADAAIVAEGLTKINHDRVTISGTGFAMVKYWDAGTSAWVADGAVINGNLIVTNTITSNQINSNGLTIRDPSGNIILNASGLGGNINYSYVSGTPTSLSAVNGTEGAKLTGIAAGATVGATIGTNLSGTFTAGNIGVYMPTAVIGTAQIKNAAIGSAQIGNLQVTNAHIDNLTIGTGKVMADQINSSRAVASTAAVSLTAGTVYIPAAITLPAVSLASDRGDVSFTATFSCSVSSTTAFTGSAQMQYSIDGGSTWNMCPCTQTFGFEFYGNASTARDYWEWTMKRFIPKSTFGTYTGTIMLRWGVQTTVNKMLGHYILDAQEVKR
ncbi:MAG: hypothetical protein WC449_05615 [Candidatus Paceibacterota bacterium]